MSNIIFELKDVHYSYMGKFPALCGIDMTIRSGEKIAVIGANGTGKSTLLQLLDGLIFPDQGNMTAFGERLLEHSHDDEKAAHRFRKRVGLVFQNADIQLLLTPIRFSNSRASIVISAVSIPKGQKTEQRRHSVHWLKYMCHSLIISALSFLDPENPVRIFSTRGKSWR